MKNRVKILGFISVLTLLIFFASRIIAEERESLVPCDLTGPNRCTFCHLFVLFDNILDFLFVKIVPPLAVLMLAFGGLLYILAIFEIIPGGFQTVNTAKNIFSGVLIGLILIYSSWFIVGLFLRAIGLADWTTDLYSSWWENGFFQINCPTGK